MPFSLLAITPPSGAVDPDLVDVWLSAAGTVGLALLLREVDAPEAALGPGRLAAVRARASAAGLAVLWSAPADVSRAALGRAAQLGLAGVQLRGDPDRDAIDRARAALGPTQLVGRSVHGPPPRPAGSTHPGRDPSAAQRSLVDYSVLAPVFDPRTTTAGGPTKKAAGLLALRAWCDAVDEPVLALGGITPDNAAACLRAGARGLAAIRTFFGPPREVADNVRTLARHVTAS